MQRMDADGDVSMTSARSKKKSANPINKRRGRTKEAVRLCASADPLTCQQTMQIESQSKKKSGA